VKLQQFFEHHGVASNPFAEEDAQSDPVFKQHCIASTYHPTWDKIYGDANDPATSIVFGEKGSGKTAIRLQLARHLAEHNRTHPERQVLVIEYDDFNPFLDRFAGKRSPRNPQRAVSQWKLWDHVDAILAIGVTGLADRILDVPQPASPTISRVADDRVRRLDRHQARDLLLLAACYDQSSAETYKGRWHRLRRKLGFRTWRAQWDWALGAAVLLVVATVIAASGNWHWLASIWPYLFVLAGFAPRLWRMLRRLRDAWAIARHLRVLTRPVGALRQILMHLTDPELAGQPLPRHQRTDDRYELLGKLQGVLRTLGFANIVVLVDRVDEPYLVNGSVEQMRALLWPMLDNKLLKHPGLAMKMLLPIELVPIIDREDREFYQRARLDKQNLISSLEWTGEALFDLANDRVRACALPGRSPGLRDLVDGAISDQRLIEACRSLRVPRHSFKFMHRLLVAHANAYTDQQPKWQITSELFESVLAVYLREQDQVDRGLKAG
jgi:hypothetical protein